jgi:hypothetical protein
MPDTDLTPASVIALLRKIGGELDDMPDTIEQLDAAEVRAQHAAKQAFRKAFLESSGAMDLRRVIADDAAADLQLQADIAGVKLRAAKTQLGVLKDQLEIGRSLNSVLKAEWQS